MVTHHSADARTALVANYIARHANLQAGTHVVRETPYLPQPMGMNVKKGSRDVFGTQGRTIYNANAHPINQGDGDDAARTNEEERRRDHWNQFLIVARGDIEEEEQVSLSLSSSSSATMSTAAADLARAEEEMFALYIRDY